MRKLIKSEPVAVVGAITAAIEAVILWVVSMGWWGLTTEQIASTMTMVIAIAAIAQIMISRAQVRPIE